MTSGRGILPPLARAPLTLDRGAARAPAAIALTPLIDIVFILLVFFMLATRFDAWDGLPLRLSAPQSATPAPAQAAAPMMLVRILAGDLIVVGGRLVPLPDLAGLVSAGGGSRDRGSAGPGGPDVAVRAEAGATIAGLVAVLALLQEAGARIALVAPPGAAE